MKTNDFFEEQFKDHVRTSFLDAGREEIYEHTLEVVEEARQLAIRFQLDEVQCVIGAYLHDIGRTLKHNEYIDVCEMEAIEILPVERTAPRILHGKISRVIAERYFDVHDPLILDAIRYHTTLHKNPTLLEKVVFLADKLSWKDAQYTELIKAMHAAAEASIDDAIWLYVKHLNERSALLKLYHPLAIEAYEYYASQLYSQS